MRLEFLISFKGVKPNLNTRTVTFLPHWLLGEPQISFVGTERTENCKIVWASFSFEGIEPNLNKICHIQYPWHSCCQCSTCRGTVCMWSVVAECHNRQVSRSCQSYCQTCPLSQTRLPGQLFYSSSSSSRLHSWDVRDRRDCSPDWIVIGCYRGGAVSDIGVIMSPAERRTAGRGPPPWTSHYE